MRSEKASLMERVAAFIVDKRNIIFLIYIAAAVFCIFSSGWVEVSDSLIVMHNGRVAAYFPDASKVTEEELGEYMLGLKQQSADQIRRVCHD